MPSKHAITLATTTRDYGRLAKHTLTNIQMIGDKLSNGRMDSDAACSEIAKLCEKGHHKMMETIQVLEEAGTSSFIWSEEDVKDGVMKFG